MKCFFFRDTFWGIHSQREGSQTMQSPLLMEWHLFLMNYMRWFYFILIHEFLFLRIVLNKQKKKSKTKELS